MLNWMYNRLTDSYDAVIKQECPGDITVKISLYQEIGKSTWTLEADTGDIVIKKSVDPTPDTDINFIKHLAESAMTIALTDDLLALTRTLYEVTSDISTPIPDKKTMAQRLWAEYTAIPKGPDPFAPTSDPFASDVITEDFRSCRKGTKCKDIEHWFENNFDISIRELKAEEVTV